MQHQQGSLFLIGNIPRHYHSCNLRTFFVDFIEKRGFTCFHFRHRPEYERGGAIQDPRPNSSSATTVLTKVQEHVSSENECSSITGKESLYSLTDSDLVQTNVGELKKSSTFCCVVAVDERFKKEFITSYNRKNWTDENGIVLPQKVRIFPLSTSSKVSCTETISHCSQLKIDDLSSLPELSPPNIMPQGNVGTPISVFMEFIKSCRLPSRVIKKLKLNFPIGKRSKRYGAVPMTYTTLGKKGIAYSDMKTEKKDGPLRKNEKLEETEDNDEDEKIPSEDDLDAEEWERYEALHEDVDKQDRTSERLFENEMEVVWDKGGSGLVFYTDASYWDEQEGDFDEKCSKEDDWDIDMGLYYGYKSCDKDAQDMRQMETERRLREGEYLEMTGPWKGGEGLGGQLLKKTGWKEGSGLGRNETGIPEPLEPEGQHPACKRGLGYHGEKLVSTNKKIKSTKEVLISTVYDIQDEEKDSISRRAPPTTLKYRRKHN